MSSRRLLFGAGLLLCSLLGACSCPGPPCVLRPPTEFEGPVFFANSSAHTSFTQLVPPGCEERLKTHSVSAEVRDEDNSRVTTTANFDQSAAELTVRVDFETRAPGWYHLTALIEPGLANVQSQLLVARDRRSVASVEVPGVCKRAQLSSGGTAFCALGSSGIGPTVSFRDGISTPELSAELIDVRADVVWAWSPSTLERRRDSPAGLQREPSTGFPQATRPLVLVSSGDGSEVFAATSAEVFRIAYRNGALTELSRIPIGTVLSADLAFVSNGTLFLLEHPESPSITQKTKVCGYSLANELITKLGSCQEVTGLPLGTGDDGVWFREEGIARVWRGNATGELKSERSISLPAPDLSATKLPLTGAPVALFRDSAKDGWVSLRDLDGRVFVDRYQMEEGFALGGASPTAVFTTSSEKTRIFAR